MRTFIFVIAVTAALAATGAASAGGWATAGVSPQPPETAGTTWVASITVLQHGRTPLSGVKPTLTIRNSRSGESKTFPAKPTGKAGVYRAEVVFPSAGTWSYEVYDGFTQYGGARAHTFAPVEVTGGDSSSSSWRIAAPAGLALLLAVVLLAAFRLRRRPALAPSVH